MKFLAFQRDTVEYLNHCLACFAYDEHYRLTIKYETPLSDAICSMYETPLSDAICSGDEEMVAKLLEENTAVGYCLNYISSSELSNRTDETFENNSLNVLTDCIIYALRCHQFEVVVSLLQNFHRTTCKLPRRTLSDSDRVNHEFLHLLLSHCHDRELLLKVKLRLIFWALREENITGLLDVIRTGVDLNIPIYKLTLIHFAVQFNERLIIILVENGADISICDNYRETPLFTAVRVNNLVTAKLLISMGADVNHRNYDHMTPLHIAAASVHDSTELVDLLLRNGAYFNVVDRHGYTPLARGIRNVLSLRMPSIIQCLVRHGSVPTYPKEMEEIQETLANSLPEDCMLLLNQAGLLSTVYVQLQAENNDETFRALRNHFFSMLSAHNNEIEIGKFNIYRPKEPMSLYGICHAKIRIYLSRISYGRSIYNIIQALSLPKSICCDLALESVDTSKEEC